jgi:hypothetical protein
LASDPSAPTDSFFQQGQKHTISNFRGGILTGGGICSTCFETGGAYAHCAPRLRTPLTVPLPFSRNQPENHSYNLGKALVEGLGLLKIGSLSLSLSLSPLYPLHLSITFTYLSLLPLYPFHLSISFTSLSLSPLYPFHLSLSLTLSLYIVLLSLPPSLYLSF